MNPDAEYLRRRFASLSDEALLAVERSELVDAAKPLFDAEVHSRGLDQAEAAAPAGEHQSKDWPGDDDATEVYSMAVVPGRSAEDSIADARQSLEEAGIPCRVEMVEIAAEEDDHPKATHRWRVLVPSKYDLRATSTIERDLANPHFEDQWRLMLEEAADDDLPAMNPRQVFCGLFDRVQRAEQAYKEELARRGLKR